MAEVLVGTEWIAVEESAEAVQDSLARELHDRREAIGEPMAATILLTLPADVVKAGEKLGGGPLLEERGRQRMTVAVSAINAVREYIETGSE